MYSFLHKKKNQLSTSLAHFVQWCPINQQNLQT